MANMPNLKTIARRAKVVEARVRGFTIEEIAEMEKCSPTTVKKDLKLFHDAAALNIKQNTTSTIGEYVTGKQSRIKKLYILLSEAASTREKARILRQIDETIEEMMKTLSSVGVLPKTPDMEVSVKNEVKTMTIWDLKKLQEQAERKVKEKDVVINP